MLGINSKFRLFGFRFFTPKTEENQGTTFLPPAPTDGSVTLSSELSGVSGYYAQQWGDSNNLTVLNQQDLINRYRNIAAEPECDAAISEIVNAAIVSDHTGSPVSLMTNELEIAQQIKDKIISEFDEILTLLDFNENASEMFRRWYIDGRIAFHVAIDHNNPKRGILKMYEIDSAALTPIKEIIVDEENSTSENKSFKVYEYYKYETPTETKLIDKDSIIFVDSGLQLYGANSAQTISYLHKSIRLVNMLRTIEDSMMVYRLARAPERRVFYIDTGNLPKGKADEHVVNVMSKFRNRIVYDAANGEIKDSARSLAVTEDFWLPRSGESGKGTQIETLPGATNLGEIADVKMFRENLYRSLNVPMTRLNDESVYNIGRGQEITRDEIKFQKFIAKLRKKFSQLLLDALRTQLLLKNIITDADWYEYKQALSIDFLEDNHYSELKDMDIIKSRIEVLDSVTPHVGTYFSKKWVRSNVLRQSDKDQDQMESEITMEENPEAAQQQPDMSGWGEPMGGEPMGGEPNIEMNAPPQPPADSGAPQETNTPTSPFDLADKVDLAS